MAVISSGPSEVSRSLFVSTLCAQCGGTGPGAPTGQGDVFQQDQQLSPGRGWLGGQGGRDHRSHVVTHQEVQQDIGLQKGSHSVN